MLKECGRLAAPTVRTKYDEPLVLKWYNISNLYGVILIIIDLQQLYARHVFKYSRSLNMSI